MHLCLIVFPQLYVEGGLLYDVVGHTTYVKGRSIVISRIE
jgi:hypothetical protein